MGKKPRPKPGQFAAGDLEAPIVAPRNAELVAAMRGDDQKLSAAIAERDAAIMRAKREKLVMLAGLYGIDLESAAPAGLVAFNMARLAIRLAEEHVRGFAVVDLQPAGSGRHRKWSEIDLKILLLQVEDYCERHKVKPHSACKELTKRGMPYQSYSHETLGRYYRRAKAT